MRRNLLALTLAFLLVGSFVSADDTKTPSFKDVLNLTAPRGPEISPDGSRIIFSVSKPNWEKNQYISQLWILDVATKEKRQLTYGEKSVWNYGWSPDGKYISFVANRDKHSQVYLLPAMGGEARAVTKAKNGVSGYSWSPCSKYIAYSGTTEKSKQEKGKEKKYGRFEMFEEEYKNAHLWVVNVESGEEKLIVDDEKLNVGSWDWSPDGKTIAFDATPDSFLPSFSKADIYLVDLESKKVSPLVTQKGPDSSPQWSPDGKTIAFNSAMGTESWHVNTEICTIPAGGGDIKVLTKEFDENAGLMDWNAKGMTFGATLRMSRHVMLLSPDGKIAPITSGDDFTIAGFSLTKDLSKYAFTYSNSKNFTDLYISEFDKFTPVKLTSYSDQIKDWEMATKEAISWKSTDGADITGVLIKPADFDPKKKYPLLVIIHGGPTGTSIPSKYDGYNRYYPIEQWAAKGAVILEPNYRGSAGFGLEFRKLNIRNLGVGDYWDVISGVDHLIDQGFVDKDKVASMGWSQGGYISAYITTFSDRFQATSVGAGISDWVTYYYRTDITPFCPQYLGATPWDDPEIYAKTSPMTHINKAKTPTLIQHGENDARVPITNGYKLYRGLKDKGVPVKFIIYKGFGHGISRPKENLAVMTHNWQWFGKYIWGEEIEEESFDEEDKDKDKDKEDKEEK